MIRTSSRASDIGCALIEDGWAAWVGEWRVQPRRRKACFLAGDRPRRRCARLAEVVPTDLPGPDGEVMKCAQANHCRLDTDAATGLSEVADSVQLTVIARRE